MLQNRLFPSTRTRTGWILNPAAALAPLAFVHAYLNEMYSQSCSSLVFERPRSHLLRFIPIPIPIFSSIPAGWNRASKSAISCRNTSETLQRVWNECEYRVDVGQMSHRSHWPFLKQHSVIYSSRRFWITQRSTRVSFDKYRFSKMWYSFSTVPYTWIVLRRII